MNKTTQFMAQEIKIRIGSENYITAEEISPVEFSQEKQKLEPPETGSQIDLSGRLRKGLADIDFGLPEIKWVFNTILAELKQ